MANRAVLQKPKNKVVRKTASESFVVNRKYLGDEYTVADVKKYGLIRAFNWYNTMCDVDEARQYIIDYYKNEKTVVSRVKRIPNDRIPLVAAWIFRIHARGYNDENLLARANDMIKKSLKHAEPEKVEKPTVEKISIQDRIKEKLQDIIGDIEALIDSEQPFSVYEYMQKNQIAAMYASKIEEYYAPICQEMIDLFKDRDPDLKEGYKGLTKKQKEAKVQVYLDIINDLKRYGSNTKKVRKPRKARPVSTDKILKLFKYQKESNEFKLVSIDPALILGANELWTFNTKNKTLNRFVAQGPSGLSVNRTSISGYDPNNSKSMKIGRKTEEHLKTVLTGGKIVLRRLSEQMNGEINGRVNETTILLKKL